MKPRDVIIGHGGGLGRITLNRPKALHALTLGMCREIVAALRLWAENPDIAAVMIDHSGERGFCAGGDVRLLYESLREGEDVDDFFRTEYRMNDFIFAYPKPTLCIMDGVVMGGGAGVAMPCRFRVATEATRYAMPETGIGLFPDVGGGWFLSRLEGRIGEWLALTGARLDGSDCLKLGLATHHVPRGELAELKTRIALAPDSLEDILRGAAIVPPPPGIDGFRADIDRLFSAERIEDIVAGLEADGSPWALEQVAAIAGKAPLSLKVALRQMAESRKLARFSDNMAMEYSIVSRLIRAPDFSEGVRAFVIDKDNRPVWAPSRLEDVSEDDVAAVFATLPPAEEWTPLGSE